MAEDSLLSLYWSWLWFWLLPLGSPVVMVVVSDPPLEPPVVMAGVGVGVGDDPPWCVVTAVASYVAADVVTCPTMVMAIAPSTPSMIFRTSCLLLPGRRAGPGPRSTM